MKKQDRIEQTPQDRAVAIKERAAKLHQEWQEEAKAAEQQRALEQAERELVREELEAKWQALLAERAEVEAGIKARQDQCVELYHQLLEARDALLVLIAASPTPDVFNGKLRPLAEALHLPQQQLGAAFLRPSAPWGLFGLDALKELKPWR
ncbi:MAG: hypothetical protein ACYC5O_12095 [Anaerolineae bacterium]